ncbi:MAG: TIGR04013 family B12-binding domain/radical SAM domain-containing protein [Promethearchaeota archaeon]
MELRKKDLQKDIAFVVYYHKNNKYSFNALIGALEKSEIFNDIDIIFVKNKEKLINSLKNVISKYKKIVLGISFFTTQLFETYDLITILKKKYGNNYNNKSLFIAGGPHPTGDPKGTLKLGFDIVVIGEGEETLIELFQKIRNNENYRAIKGIAYFDEDKIYHFTGKREPINLNKYHPFPIKNYNFGPIEITRGCPFVCYFCQTPYILGINPRHRSVESVCKYIQIMKKEKMTDIRFITPNAFSYGSSDGKHLNISKLEELLKKSKEIVGSKGKIFLGSFPSEVRPEHVTSETLGLISKYAANDNIIIGAQSGSKRILDLCHRGHTVNDIYNAVELTLKSKIRANVDFIFGLPKETEEDQKLTIKVIKDLINMGARIHTHSFIPLPQTPFAKETVRRRNKKIKQVIKNLTSRGFAFGDWKKQEKMAIKIAKYLKTLTIK